MNSKLVLSLTSNSTLILKSITAFVAILVVYHQDLQLVFFDALQNEATNQALLVLPIFGFLIYRKRKMLRAVTSSKETDQHTSIPQRMGHSSTLIGILLSTASIIFYWYGSYTFMPLEYHILTMPIFTAGLVLVLFNLETLRQLIFPILFLFFLTPIPEELLFKLSNILSTSSSLISSAVANVLGANSIVSTGGINPTIIVTRPDNSILGFSLDTACSGVYPLIAFVMFAFLTAYIIRDKPWKKAVIFLLGIPLMYLLNVLRITIVLLLGYHYGEQLALQTFHLFGGLALTIIGTVLLLTVAERIFKIQMFSRGPTAQPCSECQAPSNLQETFCHNCGRLLQHPKIGLRRIDLAKIFAVLTAVSFLILIQAPVFAVTQGPAKLIIQTPAGEQGNTQILPQIEGYNLSFIFRDRDFENRSHQDASLIYLYNPQDRTKENVWAAIEVAQTSSSLHRWEVCEIIWPTSQGREPNVNQLDLRDIQILENPPIVARYFAFQYKGFNDTQVVLYWYETSTLMINDTLEQKQVKISLISYPSSPQEIEKTENDLMNFAPAIAGYWQPTKTWTQIALMISKNGLTLSTISTALTVCMILLSALDVVRRRKATTRTYSKIPDEDRQIVDAVQKTEKKSMATMQKIAATYSITPPDLKTLNERLDRAEEAGLIRRQIISNYDEPMQTWKANTTTPKQTGGEQGDNTKI
jgi:exosortase